MQVYANEFAMYMDEHGVKYSQEKDHVIKVTYSGDNMESISVFAIFDKDDDPIAQFVCWNIASFKNNADVATKLCNKLNAQYRWVKFYVDDDNDVIASIDAEFNKSTCGEVSLSMVRHLVNIIDEAYPQIAKARWA